MASPFRLVEHLVPGQHLREYPGATASDQEEPLKLAVKQYIPLDNPDPQPGDVTILAAHANGFPKVRLVLGIELYTILIAWHHRNSMSLYGKRFTRVQKIPD